MLIAIEPDPLSLQFAARAGFRVIADDTDPIIGLRSRRSSPSRGNERPRRVEAAAKAAPQLQADYDHVFEPAGGGLMPLNASLAVDQRRRGHGRSSE